MYVDEAEAVIGLIEADIRRLVRLVLLDMEGGLVRHLNGRGWGGGGRQFGLFGKILLDEHLLTIGVNRGLSSGEKEWRHDDGRRVDGDDEVEDEVEGV